MLHVILAEYLGECPYDLGVGVLHPQERHLFTGTVLTPDGDHYKVQFDRPKQGVQVHTYVLEDGAVHEMRRQSDRVLTLPGVVRRSPVASSSCHHRVVFASAGWGQCIHHFPMRRRFF